jgi:hypothetical protein
MYERGRDCYIGANQTYHQDHHPDRTFHIALLCAGLLGAATLTRMRSIILTCSG